MFQVYSKVIQLYTHTHTHTHIYIYIYMHIYIYILFDSFPYRLLQATECTSLCYIVGPCCSSILYIVVCIC